VRFLDAAAVAALGPAPAVQAIIDALRSGLDPAADPARVAVDLANGQFLMMPSKTPAAVGVKVATIAPDNSARGLPRIQATYLLFDRDTLALRAVLDGTALTTLRTPAVSVAAVLERLPDRALRVAVIGAGPQATGHVSTLAAVRQLEDATYLVRDTSRTLLDGVALGSPRADDTLRSADIVICATSARSRCLTPSCCATTPSWSPLARTNPTHANLTHRCSAAPASSSRMSRPPFARPGM
jgi:ornithine cyclodeaminase/alanine dehydrogenase-like protein (mu-crystallin family)